MRTNKQIGELKNDPKQVAFRAEILEIKKFLNADLGRWREREIGTGFAYPLDPLAGVVGEIEGGVL